MRDTERVDYLLRLLSIAASGLNSNLESAVQPTIREITQILYQAASEEPTLNTAEPVVTMT